MTQTARTYGEALYELALEEGLTAQLQEQLAAVAAILGENPEYVRLLSLPSLPKSERCAALDESFGPQVHPYLLNFMKILTENGTIRQLPGCEEAYRRRFNEDNGILEVTAVTAVALQEDLKEKLQAALERRTGKTIHLSTRVDESLLGGVRLETEGLRLDGSVRSRLDDIQALLKGAAL